MNSAFSYNCIMQHHTNAYCSISVAFKGQAKDLIRKVWYNIQGKKKERLIQATK